MNGDHDSRKMKHREAAEALPRSLAELKLAFGEDYEEMKLVEEEEQEMKTINTVERLAAQKGISNELQAEVTKIQIQAEVMNQESYDEGTENVEEQVTEEMKKALDSNGFIGSTIDLVTGAAMAWQLGMSSRYDCIRAAGAPRVHGPVSQPVAIVIEPVAAHRPTAYAV